MITRKAAVWTLSSPALMKKNKRYDWLLFGRLGQDRSRRIGGVKYIEIEAEKLTDSDVGQ
jgi:hypothetical protein